MNLFKRFWKLLLMLALVAFAAVAFGDTGPSPLPGDPAQALSLWQYIKAHWGEISAPIFGLLLFVSEYLGQNPKVKSNGIYDWIRNYLKAKAGVA